MLKETREVLLENGRKITLRKYRSHLNSVCIELLDGENRIVLLSEAQASELVWAITGMLSDENSY